MIGEEDKRHYVLIKDFSTFMYDHNLHYGKKHFCRCCLQVLCTEECQKIMESKIQKSLIQTNIKSYGYKLVYIDDTFSKLFKIYLGEDFVYNFINTVIGESKYCNDVIKKTF